MYFKVVMNADETKVDKQTPIVRYIETDNVNSLFDLLRRYYCLENDQPAARLRMFRTVDRNEFNFVRTMNQGMLH